MIIFHRKMMISHDFTIILGVREKQISRTPPEQKKIAYPVREILASPRRPRKPNPPTGGVRDFCFFAYRVRNVSFLFFLRTGYATLRGTSVPECRERVHVFRSKFMISLWFFDEIYVFSMIFHVFCIKVQY